MSDLNVGLKLLEQHLEYVFICRFVSSLSETMVHATMFYCKLSFLLIKPGVHHCLGQEMHCACTCKNKTMRGHLEGKGSIK